MACYGHCDGCEHSREYCLEHNPPRLCERCLEIVAFDECDFCVDCREWLCDACAQWGKTIRTARPVCANCARGECEDEAEEMEAAYV
jgi:hypothetical protein